MKIKDEVSELIESYELESLTSTYDERLKKSTPYHNAFIKHRMACDIVKLKEEVKKLTEILIEE